MIHGLLLLLAPGCHLVFPHRAGSGADSSRQDSLPDDRWDSQGCTEDQGIRIIAPGTPPHQNPACDTTPPTEDNDCDGLSFAADDQRNQDFWPQATNPLVFLDGFTRPGLPGWSLQGAPTWKCAHAIIHPGESMAIGLPPEAGAQYLVQIRFSYGNRASATWKVGLKAPTSRVCTLEKAASGMRYCFSQGCESGVSWLGLESGKWYVMQLWSLDSTHSAVGDWCRIFPSGASPSTHNIRSSPTLVSGDSLTLFAVDQDLLVDQVRVFAPPVP